MMNIAIPAPPDTKQEFEFSDRDFQMISALANERYGLFLQPSKKALVHSRLAKRLRARSLGSFAEYCALLNQPEGDDERSHLLSALTTNVTHFFREVHHFDDLRDRLVPLLVAKAKAGQPLRLWSSACSSGQEAYSIAAALVAGDPKIHQYDIKILATDIDPQVVASAREGVYPIDQVMAVPESWRKTLTKTPVNEKQVQVDPALKSLISFGELNLIADWPMKRKFDVIFCRNAAIYFDKGTQARLWQRFADILVDGGHLMIGHSERLSGSAQDVLRNVGITTYQKSNTTGKLASPDIEGTRD